MLAGVTVPSCPTRHARVRGTARFPVDSIPFFSNLSSSYCVYRVPSITDDAFHHGIMPTTSTAEGNSNTILIRSGDNGSDKNAKIHPMVPVSLNVHTLHKPLWMDSEQDDDESMHMLPRTPMACTSYAGNEENQGVVFDGAGRMMEVSDDDSGEFLEQGKYSSHSSMNIRRVPLAVALLNLQCLHAGASLCYQNAWKGCPAGDWCSLESGHFGFCDQDASVPGPGAYMLEELEQVSLKTLDGSWMDLPLSKAAKDLANSVRGKSLQQACLTGASSGKAQTVRKSNRRRTKPKVDDEDGYLFGASDDSVVSGEVQLSQVAFQEESVNQRGPSTKTGRGRKENQPAIPVVSTRSSRKKTSKKNSTAVKKIKKGSRMGVRKPPQIWVKGAVQDPRSGQMITEVPPGIFCTQCSATTTPVWRAGPFGHKTLCNACGVRWMKVDPKRR